MNRSGRRASHRFARGQTDSSLKAKSTPIWLRKEPLVLAPILILFTFSGLLITPASNSFGQWLLQENKPVELLTCIVALCAAASSFKLSHGYRQKGRRRAAIFYGLFALLFVFFAMEEISWGQQLLGFSTPEFWRVRNAQDELTLHNYDFPGVVYLEAYPLIAGLIGLAGIAASLSGKLPKAISPSLLLISWFSAIALHSGIDLFHEFHIPFPAFDTLINHLDEAAEMLTAIAGFFYVHLNATALNRIP